MADILWAAAQIDGEVIDNTALASDTDGTLTVGSEVDNSTGTLYTHGVVEVELGSITPTGTPYVDIYVFYAVDGTNYDDNSASLSHAIVASLPVTTGASAKQVSSRPFPIMPYKLKVAHRNMTGQTLNASSNSVKLHRLRLATS